MDQETKNRNNKFGSFYKHYYEPEYYCETAKESGQSALENENEFVLITEEKI